MPGQTTAFAPAVGVLTLSRPTIASGLITICDIRSRAAATAGVLGAAA